MTKLRILLVTVILSLTIGWIGGRRYFTYVLFVGIEPMLYPCPYSDIPENQLTCAYRPHEPTSNIAVWWHGWPAPEGQSPVPQPSGNCLRDILFFDRLPSP
ncbi:MAG: hypothetical protein F4148_15315 [Caldilineaceae bacterium SB0675_bin_29]|uniref:Uncharacterized protein n=1 Tax=Caldilineaceae bacterium SB0675_bin_29 TaxID=2605266 RepID=A0A6B1G2A8_9CHLR|nr:hypothetical protein [Caldilineaceae bacterium SB0675_bin_29]